MLQGLEEHVNFPEGSDHLHVYLISTHLAFLEKDQLSAFPFRCFCSQTALYFYIIPYIFLVHKFLQPIPSFKKKHMRSSVPFETIQPSFFFPHLPGEGCWDLPSSVSTAGPQPGPVRAQWAPLDLNLGPSELSEHRWTAGPQPGTLRAQWAPLALNGQIECQKICQIECQIECQKECQCQKICQIKCQNVCEIECHKICQIEWQKVCQIECQIECQKVCQIKCQNVCQIERQIECQIECQKICQKICQIECQKICQNIL